MLYKFKSNIEDFFVSEVLPFEIEGKGEFFYIFFEKRNINTMDLVFKWFKILKLNRNDLGIAGLKDKNGITQQRISIGDKSLSKIGGEAIFLKLIKKDVKIIKKTRHNNFIKVGMNIGNKFRIKLIKNNNIPKETIYSIKKSLNTIKYNGFPNYFGMQRFGKGFRNVKRANKFLYENEVNNEKHVKFNLQAFSSFHFNQFLKNRIKNNQFFLEGDLLMDGNNATSQIGFLDGDYIQLFDYRKCKKKYKNRDIFYPDFFTKKIPYDEKWIPAGPIIGKNMLLPPNQSQAFKIEREFLKGLKFFEINEFNKFQLYGLRRPLIVIPKNMEFEFNENNDLILNFFLPTGSYATVLLGTVFKGIDKKTIEENGLYTL